MCLFIVKRPPLQDIPYTISELFVEGRADRLCYTLEDKVRIDQPKVPGQTAIPGGRFRIIVDMSQRFKIFMPHILDVPGFTGIRMHKGVKAEDTEGCLLVGMKRGINTISDCTPAFSAVMQALYAYKGQAWIDIIQPPYSAV